MKLWFATIDGNMIDIFNTENEAKEWQQSNTGNVCFVTEVEYNENKDIVKFCGHDFNDFLEMNEEAGTDEFNEYKKYIETEYAYRG
ncbi:hypothetical protein [Pasteurella multocida]|uniref:hypothetical protein n=1 Tax=Pasteurella multocida TaxID=747 RepID=UPI0007ED3724|nr:hypothetical protein [Pasteurella multocida]MCL7839142.1 hypothetical protein [Pasteurella multocida]OBP35180.1 hypothetical protein A0R69_04150 [Pasteurella multocida subsp. multocida]PNM09886.1 hypothetical protein A6J59_004125 [Pasteurella multocida]HDR1196575.1 hypothetical protein [Pasteurella multocida]HDR1236395.1 hypothetical protein [Pasteurella multocida]